MQLFSSKIEKITHAQYNHNYKLDTGYCLDSQNLADGEKYKTLNVNLHCCLALSIVVFISFFSSFFSTGSFCCSFRACAKMGVTVFF